MVPVAQATATILGGPTRSATGLFSACFVITAIVNIVEFTFNAGSVTVTDSWSLLVQNKESFPSSMSHMELVYEVNEEVHELQHHLDVDHDHDRHDMLDPNNLHLVPWLTPL